MVEHPRNILITGASGMIGSALTRALVAREGYRVFALSRKDSAAPFYYDNNTQTTCLDPTIPLYGVINLAGPNIADKRWSDSRKKEILGSRQRLTASLSEALAKLEVKPQILLSGSAIGYYGLTASLAVDENSPAGNDFPAQVACAWEAATEPAEEAGIAVIHLRTGIVLSSQGGALQKLLLPFKLGMGGKLGKGGQFMSWISLPDAVNAIIHLLENVPSSGPVNLVSNKPVTNAEFTRQLGAVLHRPTFFNLPGGLLRLALGEMAEYLLLGSSRVQSVKLQKLGIQLQHQDLTTALKAVL